MHSQIAKGTVPRWVRYILSHAVLWWHAQLIAIGWVAISTGIRFILQPLVHEGVPFVTYFPAIIIVGFFAGAWAGFTAIILSTGAALIWLPPLNIFRLDASSVARILAFWITSGLVLVTVYWLRSFVSVLIDSEARANTLAREMTHRVENVLTVVLGISQQTARNTSSVSEFSQVFGSRLTALKNAHALLNFGLDTPPELDTFLRLILQPFFSQNITMSGPETRVPVDVAETLALLVHELATNAIKYGSLSTPTGRVKIEWRLDGSQKVLMNWLELGGPIVVEPSRVGFGSRLLNTAFTADKGDVCVSFEPTGLRCTIGFLSVPLP